MQAGPASSYLPLLDLPNGKAPCLVKQVGMPQRNFALRWGGIRLKKTCCHCNTWGLGEKKPAWTKHSYVCSWAPLSTKENKRRKRPSLGLPSNHRRVVAAISTVLAAFDAGAGGFEAISVAACIIGPTRKASVETSPPIVGFFDHCILTRVPFQEGGGLVVAVQRSFVQRPK